jgi:adenylate cyclase
MSETRKIAAILVADVVGYSRLAGVDEDRTLSRLRGLRSNLIDPAIAAHHGRVVKRTGDGNLIEFRSVVDAVRCAIEVQNGMVERNVGVSPDLRIEFRVGIHLGDVVEESDGDLMGDGVNIAARLEGIAKPGSICLSEQAYWQVKGRLDLAVSDLGPTQLKNIADPIRVYSLQVGIPAQAKSAPSSALEKSAPPRLSIVVLPFANIGRDPEQEYFVDGMVEDIISGLSRIKWLFVIARNSSFVYKGNATDVKQVGRELGVRYVLEGSVRKAGNRVRIAAQLNNAETGVHFWSERYDRLFDDIFAVQDEIAMSVIGAIEPNLRKVEIERVKRKRPDSLDAYDFVLRALPFTYSHRVEDADNAIPLLSRALELEPGYAAAHAPLALCHHSRFRFGLREEDRVAAIHHARCAIATGNDDATALGIAGFVISLDSHDNVTALDVFDRALTLSNSNIFALLCSALVLSFMGQTEIAIERAERALRLSPFDSLNYLAYNALAISYFTTGRHEQSHDATRRSIQINPRFSVCHLFHTAALVGLGRNEEAKSAAKRVLALDPVFTIRGFSITVGFEPAVFALLADAWRVAGLPESS